MDREARGSYHTLFAILQTRLTIQNVGGKRISWTSGLSTVINELLESGVWKFALTEITNITTGWGRRVCYKYKMRERLKYNYVFMYGGRDSSVGTATRYGLDGPRIESRWGEDFPHPSDRPWGPPSLLYSGYRVITRAKAAGAWP